jgi:hypothetical protein
MVTSPFRVEAFVTPGDDGYVYLELIGEDGRTITQQSLDYRALINRSLWISPSVSFNISAVAETARLLIYVNDKYGRKIAISSTDLILLSLGNDEINPPAIVEEPYLIRYPKPGQTLQGGTLVITGLVNPVNDSLVIIELIDEQNNVVGSVKIVVPPPSGDLSHTPFSVGVPYTVSASTDVRLTMRQESSGRIPGTVELFSEEITLEP